MQKKSHSSIIIVSILVIALIGTALYTQNFRVRVAEIITVDDKLNADYLLDLNKNGIVDSNDYLQWLENEDLEQFEEYIYFELNNNLLSSLSEWNILNEDRELNELNYVEDDILGNVIELDYTQGLQQPQLITNNQVTVDGGNRYVVSGWIKTNSEINTEIQVNIDGYDTSYQEHWYEPVYIYPNNKWTFFKKEIRIPGEWSNIYRETRNVNVWVRPEEHGIYYIGDIQLRKVNREYETIEENKNLLLNSEFNSGFPRIVSPEAISLEEDHISTLVDETYFENVKLDVPETYTLSAYIKSNEDVDATAAFWIYKGKSYGNYRQDESFNVGQEWERYSYTFEIEEDNIENEGGKNIFFPGIYANHGSVSIDKVQLEKGELSDYKLNENVIINLRTNEFANVFFNSNPIFYVSLENGFSTTKEGTYEIYVTDYNSNLIYESSNDYSLEPNEFYEREIELNAEKGSYRINAIVKDSSGKVIDKYITNIAKVNRIFNNHLDENSNFGIHSNQFGHNNIDPDLINQRYRLIKESGAKWTRIFLYWNKIEGEAGIYDWELYDTLIDAAHNNNFNILLTGADSGIPNWAEEQGLTRDSTGYRSLIREVIRRYGDRISAFEIENEPYLKKEEFQTNNEYIIHFMNIHSTLSNIVESENEGITTIANVGGLGENDYFEDMVDGNILNIVDAVSLHMYPKPNSPTEYNAYEETVNWIEEHGNIEIWQTEAARFSDDLNPEFFPYIDVYNRPLSSESFAANMWIRDGIIKRSLNIVHDFYFTIATQDKIYTYYNFFNNRWSSPKLLYPAYNTLSHFIDKAEFVEKIEANNLVNMYVFEKDNQAIVALWNIADNNKESNFITNNDLSFITQYDFVGNEVEIENSIIKFNSYPNYIIFNIDDLEEFGNIIINSEFCSACIVEEETEPPQEVPTPSSGGSSSTRNVYIEPEEETQSETSSENNQESGSSSYTESEEEPELESPEVEIPIIEHTEESSQEPNKDRKTIETILIIINIILVLSIIFMVIKIIIHKARNN